MIDVSNRVLTNIETYISDICGSVVSGPNKAPPSFPAVQVTQIDNPDVGVDLENSENAVKSVVEIQCYSNKNQVESKQIINRCCDAMRIMGYVRTYGPKPVGNVADTSLYRTVARFNRTVSSVNEIKKFETKGA